MTHPLWTKTLAIINQDPGLPVISKLLNTTTLLEIKDGRVVASCPNPGARLFLESRRAQIETILSGLEKNPISVVFVVSQKGHRSRPRPLFDSLPASAEPAEGEKENTKDSFFSRFTFKNFAVSSTNQIAYAAAQAVSENPGSSYNPLFIYGGVGVGKTHLAHAIINQIRQGAPAKKTLFCSSEEFTNDLIEQIRGKNTAAFRQKYRLVDVLVVDDVQFIAGKNAVQEEFYHTFNSIIKNAGQIILTSDQAPAEIKRLEDRLRSRFSGGLTIDIQPPGFELRAAILLIKARERQIDIDLDTAKLIADQTRDTRELEGRLVSFYARSLETGLPITREEVLKEAAEKQRAVATTTSPHQLIRLVCSYYQLPVSLVKSGSRKERLSRARQMIMYLLRVVLRLTYGEIAGLLNRKDHTTIIHGADKITALSIKDAGVRAELDKIIASFSYPQR